MRRRRSQVGTLAIVLACALAGMLLTAVPASALSLGFDIYNLSSTKLRLTDVSTLNTKGFENGVSPRREST